MATAVIMPKFGMTQEDGTIIRWLKGEGDAVQKGETLLEVQTDKVDMEVEAPASGILRDIRYGVDATVRVATQIALIAQAGEGDTVTARPDQPKVLTPAATRPQRTEAKVSPVAQRMAAAQGIDPSQVAGSGLQGRVVKADIQQALAPKKPHLSSEPVTPTRLRTTPAARRLSHDAGLDLAAITGSGPGGRIQAADVVSTLAAQTSPQPPVAGALLQPIPLAGMRKTIAARMALAWQTIPHIFLSTSVDMSATERLRAGFAAEARHADVRLTPTVLIARCVATALLRHPRLNAWLLNHEGELALLTHDVVNLGVAVALDDGLIVPVIKDVARLGVLEIARRMADLAQRSRAGQLKANEVMDGTFTITNLGMHPVDHFTAIINPPQVAILAVGRTQIKPQWDGSAFRPTPMMEVTLSADHRAVDGTVAALFLADLKRLLEEPALLLLQEPGQV